MDLFLNKNYFGDIKEDFFHTDNRQLWSQTREVTMQHCNIKTIHEAAFQHLEERLFEIPLLIL